MRSFAFAAFLGSLLIVAACAGRHAGGMGERRSDVLYSCACGPECACGSVSTEPGNCRCGKPMKWGHMLRVEGSVASLCGCEEGCRCAGLDPKDPSKCACGKPVKKVDLKGTGIYFCNCGGSCGCNTASKTLGRCRCGMDLKQAH